MATYRLLADHYIGTALLLAGSTQTTSDIAGALPTNWKPSGNVDPLDAAAVNAFYAQAPQPLGLVRMQWSGLPVSPPITRWQATNTGGTPSWTLTGLGAGLAPIVQ